MSLTLGTRLGVYEVTGKIGEGGMGEVYQARDTTLDRGAFPPPCVAERRPRHVIRPVVGGIQYPVHALQ